MSKSLLPSIHPWTASLQLPHGDLPQPVPGQGSQLLRGWHIQHHLEVPLGWLNTPISM